MTQQHTTVDSLPMYSSRRPNRHTAYSGVVPIQGFPTRSAPAHQWIPGISTPRVVPQRVVPMRPVMNSSFSGARKRHAKTNDHGYVVAARVIITGVFTSALIAVPTACYAVAVNLPSSGR